MDRDGSHAARVGAGLNADLFPVTTVEQRRSALLRGTSIDYVLKRSQRRRSVAFVVDERGLTVHAPWRATEAHIETAMQGAARWIVAKVTEWASRTPAPVRQWQSGETVEYLGLPVILDVADDPLAVTVELTDVRTLKVRAPTASDPARLRELVVRWYRRHALRHFAARLGHFADGLALARPKLALSDAGTRWGSCNSRGQVRLNWRLMQAPEHLVDYVVAHEVAHLVHLDHSPRFWRTVGRIFPAYDTARTELAALTRHFMAL